MENFMLFPSDSAVLAIYQDNCNHAQQCYFAFEGKLVSAQDFIPIIFGETQLGNCLGTQRTFYLVPTFIHVSVYWGTMFAH